MARAMRGAFISPKHSLIEETLHHALQDKRAPNDARHRNMWSTQQIERQPKG